MNDEAACTDDAVGCDADCVVDARASAEGVEVDDGWAFYACEIRERQL